MTPIGRSYASHQWPGRKTDPYRLGPSGLSGTRHYVRGAREAVCWMHLLATHMPLLDLLHKFLKARYEVTSALLKP